MNIPNEKKAGESAHLLQSLNEVGETKIVGYLPLYTIRKFLGAELDTLVKYAADRGMSALALGPDECCIESGALYVYEKSALADLLGRNYHVLREVACPLDPDSFIRYIAANWFEPDQPITAIIRVAFGDPTEPNLQE